MSRDCASDISVPSTSAADKTVTVKRLVDTSIGQGVLGFYGDGVVSITLLDAEGWEARRVSGATPSLLL